MTHHRFNPVVYHTTIGWHEPVLRLAPGDKITTTTVDARGRNAADEQVTERGNPMTGPFFVEGAEAGDTLVVSLDRLKPNRQSGWTATKVAPNVLEPGYEPVFADKADLHRWHIDKDRGTLKLATPGLALTGVEVPMSPMVGCFGVAPAGRQAISTATSSTHGGNMDYRAFAEGARVYFPVEAPGALFHIGDGHAIQGDGEIVGTGVEISFEVTFTLDLIKGKAIGWPRAENGEYIMAVGNARPLDQCVQHATTEMLGWLQDDYGLDARSAHALLGQFVEYDVGNVYDPAYTVVCKISRAILAKIGVAVG